jgi:hypothetical protein
MMARRFGQLLALTILGLSTLASAQAPAALKLGIFPFTDATASGNRTAGTDVGRTMMSEVTHSTTLMPRMLSPEGGASADDLDPEKAVAIGRDHHVDLVFMGTVLEAKSEQSNKGGWVPSIGGQSANVNLHHVKASVTLQGDLYDVASGKLIFSERVSASDSNNKVGATAITQFGSWGNDTYGAFLESPLGKALQKALADMTKKVAAAKVPSSN